MPPMQVLLANPRGFCAGVDRAIEIVERALESFGAPIYVRHEVVHNRFVVDSLRKRGAVFVEELDEVPDGATVIFSAHGVSQQVRVEAAKRGLNVFDATCPLVTKVHIEVARHGKAGHDVILIGHAGHPEVEGTMGQWNPSNKGRIHLVETPECVAKLNPSDPAKLAYVSQTTLSVDDTRTVIDTLRARFPKILGPRHDDICYATQNRQDAVRELGQREWLASGNRVGLTAGASAPESLVVEVIERLKSWGVGEVRELAGQRETMTFALPKELRIKVVD